ncbi:hypothetical protein MYK68_06650 [Gordonia sp. PP30]|uniref:hypothetical protein n=1 Tax=Gordonia sp. PP30 TaxID=2935861 RepID=UPI001FFEC0BF|nr:hypothetical protein [Gordonia sp. PP30]UQE76263.1 hypothetical protein MYK68_06650 [Gordonia sp. PP30]
MTYSDPQDPRRRPPQTRAYSQDSGYTDPRYTQSQPAYDPQGYPQTGYSQSGYPQSGAPAKPPRQGPDIDPLLYSGGVFMTGVVTGLAGWLVAWIIGLIARGVNATGHFGWWSPLDPGGEYWYAIVGFVAALLGGALWFVLTLVTPTPNSFYRWIVGLLIVAAFVVPLATQSDIWSGLVTGILQVCIGLPILSLIPTMGDRSRRTASPAR